MTDSELKVGRDDAEYRELRNAALNFLGFAFEQLARWHILPTPMARRFLRVGRDYEGADVMPSREFSSFEESLRSAFPQRFPEEPARATQLPSGWIFALLEASIAECVAMEEDLDPGLSFISDLLDELVTALEAETEERVHCRVVTHLTTPSLESVSLAGVTVFPIPNGMFTPEIARAVRERIPMAAQAFAGLPPTVFESPVSLIVAQSTTANDAFDELETLSLKVDRFLLLARLITGSTARSSWAIGGSVRRIAPVPPQAQTYSPSERVAIELIKRIGVIDASDAPGYEALSAAIDEAKVVREGKMMTSFDMALGRFTRSYRADDLADVLVDLATALEASLLGGDSSTEEVGLRLRSRASAILATASDPAPDLFRHIGELYGVRSKLVHGGSMRVQDFSKMLARIVPGHDVSNTNISFAHAIDRLRDIVRRAILARLVLAADETTAWSLDRAPAVDALLSADETRQMWRARWRARMTDLGIEKAAEALPWTSDMFGNVPTHPVNDGAAG